MLLPRQGGSTLPLLLLLLTGLTSGQQDKSGQRSQDDPFNRGVKSNKQSKPPNQIEKSKVDVLGSVLKKHIEALRKTPDKQLELVFLIDSSASVGAENFFNELKFVKKLLADFTVEYNATRVSVITFSSRNRVVRHIDHVGEASVSNHKCALFDKQLPTITYQGGGTYTLGAVLQAQEVLEKARPNATKAVFLVTDGYSNGGDPRPAAKVLRDNQVEVFTFGIQNGNVKELYDMASDPPEEHSYILDSFEEFEALARRALHEDLQIGSYLQLETSSCDRLCPEESDCCDVRAQCACGTTSGHYACLCDKGFYGTGLKGDCKACPGGTYRPTSSPGDLSSCLACPDVNQVSFPASNSVEQCQCMAGYRKQGKKCIVLECPALVPPENGFFVSACGNVYNAACGIRCQSGYKLYGTSIRLCAENGSWTGEETVCKIKTCPALSSPRNGNISCTTEDNSFETECFFSCGPGYYLVGSKMRTCLSISLWDGLPALCRQGPQATLPKIVHSKKLQLAVMASVNYSKCNEKSQLGKAPIMIRAFSVPTVSCPVLKPAAHGSVSPAKCSKGKSSYKDECFYECESGFELSGSKSRRCVDTGVWSDPDNVTTCVDIEAPSIKCPEDIVVDAEVDETSALVEWPVPHTNDNSGDPVTLTVIPAIMSPRRFDIGIATVMYSAEDKARNRARCNFTVTVRDMQPPTVDRCISPSIFLSRVLPVTVSWEEPLFSDNSRKSVTVWRSHDSPAAFPLGSTDVIYDVRDEAGNNNTCIISITVQEHACAFPPDPQHGRVNCTEADNGVFCSTTCNDGYGFAMKTPPFYFCAYDGIWQPSEFLPFPDCSITFFSNSIFKMGTVSVLSSGLSCDNNFLLAQLEKHLERKISNRVSRICMSNVICEVENMIAECEDERDRMEEESNTIFRRKRHLHSTPRMHSRRKRSVPLPHVLAKSKAMNRSMTSFPGYIPPEPSYFDPQNRRNQEGPWIGDLIPPLNGIGSDESDVPVVGNVGPLKRGDPAPAVNHLLSEEVLQNKIELEFQLIGKMAETSEERREQNSLMNNVQTAMQILADAAHRGELDISLGNNRLHVEYVKFDADEPLFVCEQGTIAQANICLKCPVGTYFNVVSETCEACSLGTYQFLEGQFSCLVCPDRTSTTTGQSKSVGECKAQCLPGTFSLTGLEPCETCPIGYYQQSYSQFECIPCVYGTTTYRRGVRSPTECKAPCPPGEVSRIGLLPCFPCPDGFFQPHEAGKSCFSCPDDLRTGTQGAKSIFSCQGISEDVAKKPLPASAELTINDCFSVPCMHGASCRALEIGFLCICKPGYTGIYCESEIDECEIKPCRNGGSCQDEINGYKCFCPPGYTGDRCEEDVDDCKYEPCFNGATCFDKINGFYCQCTSGYVGPLCQYNVDECISNPCQNDGFCVDLIANYTCDCMPGFQGRNCETNIDDCINSPCKNNATCIDDVEFFTCECPAGFGGRLCDVNINECRPEPCMNGATCVDRVARFKCLCPPSYMGDLCETELSSDFLLHFPYSGILDFVQLDSLPRELREVTLCFWMTSADKLNYGTPFSYAEDNRSDNLFTLTDYSGFVLYVNMDKVVTDVTANDGHWHHICVTWSSSQGAWALYKDGQLGDSGLGLATGTRIPVTGTLVLGQEQDQRGAGFSSPESFIGTMTLLNIWDRVMDLAEIASFVSRCDKYNGNVRSWADFLTGTRGRVEKKDTHFCSGCAMPEPPNNGEVSISGMKTQAQLTYSCNPGYEVKGVLNRKCLASGNWSNYEPQCARISCEFPGYIANGYINGRQYFFQDIIQYVCNPGYRLVGASTRTCQVDNRWSGDSPSCEEILCDTPSSLDNGAVVASHPQYRLGHRIQFSCDDGYRLDGTTVLICASNGQWNDTLPTCQPRSCESPPRVPHGHILSPLDNLDVGSVVRYRCDEGFEMGGAGEMHCELKNRWAGDLPRCERVTCDTPPTIPHGTFEGTDYRFGSTITYKCDRGYELSGVSSAACQANKLWSGLLPDCLPVSCGGLELPDKGGIDMTDVTFGSIVKYYCHTGYELQGVRSRKCRSSGEWSGETPTCVPVSCSQPESISNGRYIGSDWTVGNTITYSCNPGYILIGEMDRVCLETGQWLHEVPSCEPIECPVPDGIPNGSLKNDGRRFGQRTTYHCDEGHQLVGHPVRVCMEDQLWEPVVPECKPVSCGPPPQGENLLVATESHVFRGKAMYSCQDGFRLDGPQVRVCQSNCKWSGLDPTCEIIRCPEPITVAHAYMIYSDSRYGSVVEYYCDEGFKFIGPIQRLCSGTGEWEGIEPECVRVRCPLPPPVANGDISANNTTYQNTATFSCHEGYELKGPSQRTCLQDETWSGVDPTCVAIRCPTKALTLVDGRVIGNSDVMGATIQYECDVGFNLIGPSTRTCGEDKKWSGHAPRCERVECPLPVAPPNGKISWRGHSFSDALTIACHDGYTLSGDGTRTCLPDGTWGGSDPQCKPIQCDLLPNPSNGRTVVKSVLFGGRTEYECNAGYKLKGSRRRICKADRRWSDKEPVCQQILCPEPPSILYGYHLTPGENLTVGVIVDYACGEGFNLEYQAPRISCNLQGKWTGLQPSCRIVTCPKPPSLQFGFIDGKNYTYKNAIHFSCNLGWKLIGETTLTCQTDGAWSAPFPTCEGTLCPHPAHIENGFISSSNFSNGAFIRYSCVKGHDIVGTNEQKCQNDNTWSNKPPKCKPVTCELPKNISHGTMMGLSHDYGSNVTYECDVGYELHGASVLFCTENRTWSSDVPICEEISCPLPDPLIHGEVLVHSFTKGSTGREIQVWPTIENRGDITVDGKTMLEASRSNIFHLGDRVVHKCSTGYRLSGESHRVCQETGSWSKDVPECKAVTCNSPENLLMGDMVVTSFEFTAEVSYNCDKGYKMKGPSTRKCQANATWSYGLPSCQPIVCPVIQNIPHGFVKWTSLRYGASATYECLPGYKIIGKSVRLCELTGQWSDEEPYCVARECEKLASIKNGWIESEGIIVGNTATYHCDDGYELEGTLTRSCLVNESWSSFTPHCKIVSCMSPPAIQHGHADYTNLTFGSSAEYKCDLGYELEGNSYIKCLSNKAWSGDTPKCTALPCPRPVPPSHGTVLFRSLVVESVVHFSCSEGYEIVGSDNSSTCLPNQTWNSDPPTCRMISCTPIKSPRHGQVLGTNSTFGTKLSFKCNAKYRLDEPETVTCLASKNWSKSAPKCRRYLCDVPDSVANSEVPIGPYVVGHLVEYFCKKGYILQGNKTLMCDSNGQWQGELPSCEPVSCGTPPPVAHSQTIAEDKWTLGGTVTYACEHGYLLKGAVTITCGVDGQWSDAPFCEEINCAPPPMISYANVTVEKKPGLSIASYTCEKGYKLLGHSKHSCVGSGTWNINGTSCDLVICGEPPSIPFGGITHSTNNTVGSRRTYHCFPGFRIVGTPTIQCSWQGVWEGKPPHCVPISCPPPTSPEHGFVDGEDFSFQSAVLYSCQKGYQIYGRDTRFCLEDGTWSGELPLCRKISCGKLEAPENGYIVQNSLGVYLDKIQFACQKGFKLIGEDMVRCTDSGKWDKQTPRCAGVTCSVPTTLPSNVGALPLHNKVFGVGDRILFSCEAGFRAYGEMTSHCLTNGTWSVPTGVCKKMSCGRPRTNSGAILLGMSYQYRDHLVVVCPPGSKVKGKKILTCESIGEWDGKAECEGMCSRPCLNGGVCIPPGLCSCPSGFVGDVCQHAVCIFPCLNGGTCIGPYKCQCKDGFTGTRCQSAVTTRKRFPYG